MAKTCLEIKKNDFNLKTNPRHADVCFSFRFNDFSIFLVEYIFNN